MLLLGAVGHDGGSGQGDEERARLGRAGARGQQTLLDVAVQFGRQAQPAVTDGEVHPGKAAVVARPTEHDVVSAGGREVRQQPVDELIDVGAVRRGGSTGHARHCAPYSAAMAKEEPFIEVVDGPTRWRFEADFLRSTWTCIWGRGCQGILDHPAEDLQQGCCSVGAEMGDAEEAMTVSATAAAIRTNIKVLVGACIFLNRPGSAACWVRQDDRRHGRQDPARSVPPPPASMAPLNNPAQV